MYCELTITLCIETKKLLVLVFTNFHWLGGYSPPPIFESKNIPSSYRLLQINLYEEGIFTFNTKFIKGMLKIKNSNMESHNNQIESITLMTSEISNVPEIKYYTVWTKKTYIKD